MRKLFLVITSIFTILSVVFVFLPLGTLGLIPVGVALLFGFLALQKSDVVQGKLVKVLMVFAALSLITIAGKEFFIKDEVAKDTTFEKQKIATKKEAEKELEELEDLE
jgi:hypothetical protein